MPLISREITGAMEEANRANSQKSTGPKTKQGKLNSRRNAFRHGLNSDKLCPWAEELEEDNDQYRFFCNHYQKVFQVRDEVEGLLVADLARTQWRLDRLLHAESACLAWQRAKVANDQRRKLAGEGLGLGAAFQELITGQLGYSGLKDTEAKYDLILFLLRHLRAGVQDSGYREETPGILQLVYGKESGGLVKETLLRDHELLKPEPGRDPAGDQLLRQEMVGNLDDEIEKFKILRECMREESARLLDMKMDSLLLLPKKAAKIAGAAENRLRHYMQQTLKQLMAWRQQPEPIEPASGGQPHKGPGRLSREPAWAAARDGAHAGSTGSVPDSPNGVSTGRTDARAGGTPRSPETGPPEPVGSERRAEETTPDEAWVPETIPRPQDEAGAALASQSAKTFGRRPSKPRRRQGSRSLPQRLRPGG